jgi:hypothetical protein
VSRVTAPSGKLSVLCSSRHSSCAWHCLEHDPVTRVSAADNAVGDTGGGRDKLHQKRQLSSKHGHLGRG